MNSRTFGLEITIVCPRMGYTSLSSRPIRDRAPAGARPSANGHQQSVYDAGRGSAAAIRTQPGRIDEHAVRARERGGFAERGDALADELNAARVELGLEPRQVCLRPYGDSLEADAGVRAVRKFILAQDPELRVWKVSRRAEAVSSRRQTHVSHEGLVPQRVQVRACVVKDPRRRCLTRRAP